jgi:hypothetical protein|tara:strand:- start:8920 stop:10479 length:1560 start_codon:yes stop_codon:yes gene_type:complete
VCKFYNFFFLFSLFFSFGTIYSQTDNPIITTKVDTTTIKVGEQINYEIKIESNNIGNISFPEKYQFNPFVIAEDFPIDTIDFQRRKSIYKRFNLTSFDQGNFVIKPQEIIFGDKKLYSDSLLIEVLTVEVDTVSKKFFDIKEINQTKESKKPLLIIFSSFLIILFSALIIYFLYKKFILSEIIINEYDTPFEIAINSLNKLDEKKITSQVEYKIYYTQMTDIIKNYFEKDVEISALESTSNELIQKIILLKKSNKLKLSIETINDFKKVLENADLVKFAKYTPNKDKVIDDKKLLQSVLVNTKKAIPNDIEKELEERKKREKEIEIIKKTRKNNFLIISSLIVLLSVSISSYILFPESFKNILVLDSNKKTLKNDWIGSNYTPFNLYVESPDALIRVSDSLKNKRYYELLKSDYKVRVKVDSYSENQDIVGDMLKDFKDMGFINVITKEEEFITQSEKKGVKIYGSFDDSKKNKKLNYSTIIFVSDKNIIEIVTVYEQRNEIVEQIINRIENSIDFING